MTPAQLATLKAYIASVPYLNSQGVVTNVLTVGTSATDIILDNNVLANGQAITINTATLTHA